MRTVGLRALMLAMWMVGRCVGQAPVGIDFSYAGYGAGGTPPAVAAVLTVRPSGGDDAALLQGAIDRIGAMPLQANGFRGALLLQPGRYRVEGQLRIRTGGIVVRGADAVHTIVLAVGTGRRALIAVGARRDPELSAAILITHDVRAGGRVVVLDSTAGLAAGDRVVVTRPSTAEWISAMSMSGLPGTFANQRLDWKPGSHDLVWDRTVTAVDAASHAVTLDAPITTALEKEFGGGTLSRVTGEAAATHIGIENLTLESAYDHANLKDEEHAWIGIAMDHVDDA